MVQLVRTMADLHEPWHIPLHIGIKGLVGVFTVRTVMNCKKDVQKKLSSAANPNKKFAKTDSKNSER